MKEEDIKLFNKWAEKHEDGISYVRLVLTAFEDAYLCLCDIEDERKRDRTAFEFIEEINNYIQTKRIQARKYENKRLETIIKRVKYGIDNGLLDYWAVCVKNEKRTKEAREVKAAKDAERRQNKIAKEEEKKADQQRQFDEMFNKLSE